MQNPGYHKRWFVLDNEALTYFDGKETKMKDKKGEIKLGMIRGVEAVDDAELDGKYNVLQVIHQCRSRFDFLKLYIITRSKEDQEKWIRCIRTGALSAGAKFLKNFHPGVYTEGRFTCCKGQNFLTKGCKLMHLSEDESTSAGINNKNEWSEANTKRPPAKIPPTSASSDDQRSLRGSKKQSSSKKASTFKKLYSANYEYKPMSTGELELVKGNLYEVEDISQDDWWFATDYQNGKTGDVPKNYLLEVTSPEHYMWYFGGTPKEDCRSALETDGRTGCFLVRDSSGTGYTFSFFDGATVKTYRIQNPDPKTFFIIAKEEFTSVPELIGYYYQHTIGSTGCNLTCFPR